MRIVLDACVPAGLARFLPEYLRGRPFPVVLLRAHSNSLEHLVPLVPQLLAVVETARPGDLRVVGA